MFEQHVQHPSRKEEFYQTMKDYARMGLHGAVGSMDATHISSFRIPASQANAHSSFKHNNPARSYNITVSRKGKILHSTSGFPGRWNDKTIVRYDDFYSLIMENRIGDDVFFYLYYKDPDNGEIKLQQYQGVWIIVDNGYLNESITVPPSKSTMYKDESTWSKWLESVRKDVECAFGRLKGRFHILSMPSRLCEIEHMDNVWKTCCSLHNILFDHDNQDNNNDNSWENVTNLQEYTIMNMEQNLAVNDIFIDENNNTNDAMYPNGGNVIPVKKLRLQEFKHRLVKHFTICKMLNQVHWNDDD